MTIFLSSEDLQLLEKAFFCRFSHAESIFLKSLTILNKKPLFEPNLVVKKLENIQPSVPMVEVNVDTIKIPNKLKVVNALQNFKSKTLIVGKCSLFSKYYTLFLSGRLSIYFHHVTRMC